MQLRRYVANRAFVTLFALSVTLVPSGTAFAEPLPIRDGFEAGATQWWVFGSGGSPGVSLAATAHPDLGSRHGRIQISTSNSWVTLARTFRMDPAPPQATCFAEIYLATMSGTPTVRLDIVAHVGWSYVHVTGTSVRLTSSGYQRFSIGGFPWRTNYHDVRVNVSSGTVDIDNFAVTCPAQPR